MYEYESTRRMRPEEIETLNYILEAKRRKKKTKDLAKLRCAIYARKSQPDEKDTSLDTQINYCKDMITKSELLELTAVFQEDNVSGMWTDQRPEFMRMIQMIESRDLDVCVVMRWDRFSRNAFQTGMFVERIRAADGFVLAGDDTYDSDTPAGLFGQTIFWANNMYQALTSAERTMLTMINIAKKGENISGAAPFGYRVDHSKHLVIDDDEAIVINLIFQRLNEGSTYQDVQKELVHSGFKTREGHDFSKSTIMYIAKNEKYCGNITYNKKFARKKKHRLLRKPYEEVRITGGITTPIIDQPLFDAVQQAIATRAGTRTTTGATGVVGYDFLLSGIIRCSHCQKPIIGESAKQGRQKKIYHTYECPKHKKSRKCPTTAINCNYLESYIKRLILELVNSKLGKSLCIPDAFSDVVMTESAAIIRLNKHIKSKRDKLTSLSQSIGVSMSDSLRQTLIASMEVINDEIKECDRQIKEHQNRIQQVDTLVSASSSGATLSEDDLFGDSGTTRRLIHLFIQSIDIDDDGVNGTITVSLNEGFKSL